jgi:hypothetical protein
MLTSWERQEGQKKFPKFVCEVFPELSLCLKIYCIENIFDKMKNMKSSLFPLAVQYHVSKNVAALIDI